MEYHKTFANYKACKLRLFTQSKASVINIDDDGMGQDILAVVESPYLTYSNRKDSEADLIWTNIAPHDEGLSFDLHVSGDINHVQVPIYGDYNVGNLVAAIGAALLSDVPLADILAALPQMKQVEGRFQVIQGPDDRKIVLDYAHTPVALDAIMGAVKKYPHNRLITLIAGIGIRDFAKMPKYKTAGRKARCSLLLSIIQASHPWKVVTPFYLALLNHICDVLTAPSRREAVLAFA
jgi:UDP-N-acetylmuramoyl-L-alanyl-D-glutamate--2,6-diaminopimelate ligase